MSIYVYVVVHAIELTISYDKRNMSVNIEFRAANKYAKNCKMGTISTIH